MMRIAFVWLPDWPIDRMRRTALARRSTGTGHGLETWPGARDASPFALIEAGTSGLTLSAINTPARQAGLRVGQTLADARAGLPGLATCPAEPTADRQSLDRLALWAGRYGPRRNSHGADGFWVDITGVEHLFGGEEPLARDLLDRLQSFGVSASLGIADTLGAAYVLAHYLAKPHAAGSDTGGSNTGKSNTGRSDTGKSNTSRPARASASRTSTVRPTALAIAPAGMAVAAIATAPVEGLRLDTAAVILLKRLGLRQIGDLYTLPRAALEERFRSRGSAKKIGPNGGQSRHHGTSRASGRGTAEAVMTRLDHVLGRAPELLATLVEPPLFATRAVFAEPLLTAAGVEHATEHLAQELAHILIQEMIGVRRARLRLYRTDGTVASLGVGTSAPCQDALHLAHLFSDRLASIDAGFGIDAIVLEAIRTEPLEDAQASLARSLDTTTRVSATVLVDRLTNRLGANRVMQIEPRASHIPEQADHRCAALGDSARHSPASARNASDAKAAFERHPVAGAYGRRGKRPPLLLAHPEPISVIAEVPEGAPLRFIWRRRDHRIRRAEGPERISPEWWTELPGRTRDELSPAGNGVTEDGAGEHPSSMTTPRRRTSRTRDYYVLEDDSGGRFWIFRHGLYRPESEDGPPTWYMHGLYC